MADSRRATFRKLDVDGDKLVSPSELNTGLRDVPPGTFQAIDSDMSGFLDTKEWLFSFLHADLSGLEGAQGLS